MNEQELRQLVRDAVARHLGTGTPATPAGRLGLSPSVASTAPNSGGASNVWSSHPSHHLFLTVINSGDACVIEPAVACDHCGYCKSHGH